MKFDLYTDGSCSAKDRVGGWAFYSSSHPGVEDYGYDYDTTISRMELMAAIMGLAEIGAKYGASRVTVFSDSEYVVKGITDRSRKRNLNQDLWGLLDEVVDTHQHVEFVHVRGHAGNDGNEFVDQMARGARNFALMERDDQVALQEALEQELA